MWLCGCLPAFAAFHCSRGWGSSLPCPAAQAGGPGQNGPGCLCPRPRGRRGGPGCPEPLWAGGRAGFCRAAGSLPVPRGRHLSNRPLLPLAIGPWVKTGPGSSLSLWQSPPGPARPGPRGGAGPVSPSDREGTESFPKVFWLYTGVSQRRANLLIGETTSQS